MSRWVAVGRVGRPHGLGGAFVVEAASDDPARLAPGAKVYVAGEPAEILERKLAGGRPVVRLDRPVERGVALELPADELPPPGEGEFYAFQLVGLAAEEESGRRLGTVVGVEPGVANDVLELDTGHALPLVEDCVLAVEPDRGRILVARGYGDTV
ncbi:MAG: hypothetical protein IT201_07835 [Thermoleophilia bacterium]|nr:hypothetical protein [Thermoleophilia bacterium]